VYVTHVKLKAFSGKEICRLLQRHGFQEVKRKGSHVIMQKLNNGISITVPIPDHKEIRVRTLLSIIRQSGVPRSEFE